MELDMTTAITQDIAVLGDLPQWNLADLYPATDSAELEADLDRAARASRAFSDRWKGKLAGLSGDVLGKAIADYEAIDEIMKLATPVDLTGDGSDQDDALDDGFDETEVAPVKAKAKRGAPAASGAAAAKRPRAAAKKTTYVDESDDDDDVSAMPPPAAMPSASSKRTNSFAKKRFA